MLGHYIVFYHCRGNNNVLEAAGLVVGSRVKILDLCTSVGFVKDLYQSICTFYSLFCKIKKKKEAMRYSVKNSLNDTFSSNLLAICIDFYCCCSESAVVQWK